MKFLKPLTSRFAMVTIALLSQLGFIVLLSRYFENMMAAAEITVRLIGVLVMCVVLNQINNPSIAMTWIVFILISPVFGSVLYLLVGGKQPGKKVRKLFGEFMVSMEDIGLTDDKLNSENPEIFQKSCYLRRLGFPVYKNTQCEYFPLGDDAFSVMLRELEKAKKFIFMEYFILEQGEMLDKIMEILEKKANEGVEVRILYDDMGSMFTLPGKWKKSAREKGIKCIAFNPYLPMMNAIMNNRDHRKILVIDSAVAFTGGINIADEYINKKEKYGHWKDNVLMLKGEGAKEFTLLFLQMWNPLSKNKENIGKFFPEIKNEADADGYVQPFSDTPLDDNLTGENIYVNAITNAKKYIYIFTPYLIPDQVMIRSLCLAAEKGVDVRIMVPGIPDKKIVYSLTKSYYGPLIKCGVKIYKYLPGFLHAKGFVCDDETACLGTVNVDYRSLYHHFECGCVLYNTPAVMSVKEDFQKTLCKCEKIEKYQRIKGLLGSTYHAVLRLIAPLM